MLPRLGVGAAVASWLGAGAGRAEVGEGSDGRGQAVSSRGGKESAAAVAREMGRRVAGGRCWAGWAERPKRRRLLEQGRRGELGWGWCWAAGKKSHAGRM